MTFDASNEPDWDALRAIDDEAEALIAEGKWTEAEFERLLVRAEAAVKGHDEYLEGFLMKAPRQAE